jgi:hypothetical protein
MKHITTIDRKIEFSDRQAILSMLHRYVEDPKENYTDKDVWYCDWFMEFAKQYNVNSSAQKLGKLGGQATKKKYGKTHYQKLAKHMNEVVKLKKQNP